MAQGRKNFDIVFTTKGATAAKQKADGLTGSFDGLATAAKGAASAFVAYQAAQKAVEFAKIAAQSDSVARSFRNLAKEPDKILQSMKKASAGTISEMQLMQKYNEAALLGLPLERFDEMMEIARGAAQATGQSMDYMLSSITTGLGRQSKLMLDNLGILISVEDANKSYAEVLGKTVSELTDQEKKIGFVNAALDAGGKNLKNLGGVVDTNYDKFQALGATFDDLKVRIGQEFLPVVVKSVEAMTSFADAFNPKRIQDYAVGLGVATTALGIYTVAQHGATAAAQLFAKALPVVIFTTIVMGIAEVAKEIRGFREEADKLKGWAGKTFKIDEMGAFKDKIKDLNVEGLQALAENLGLTSEKQGEMVILTEEQGRQADLINAQIMERLKLDADLIALSGEKGEFKELEIRQNTDMIDIYALTEEKFKEHIRSQRNILAQKSEEERFNARLIAQYPEMAKQLGLVTKSQETQTSAYEGGVAVIGMMNDSVMMLGAAGIKTGKIGKRVAQTQAIVDTYASANAAYKAALALPPPGGLILAPIVAAAAIAAGLENVKQIEKAEFGMDRMVSSPTLILAGEAGPERVNITPSTRASSEGGGEGMTINFLGPVTDREFVRDTIIPEIARVQKLGLA